MRAGVLWPLIFGGVKSKLLASGLSGGAACSLWRGVWVSGRVAESTAAQQGAAPDRPQCCRFCGSPARLVVGRGWRAAGELVVVWLRAVWAEIQHFGIVK